MDQQFLRVGVEKVCLLVLKVLVHDMLFEQHVWHTVIGGQQV